MAAGGDLAALSVTVSGPAPSPVSPRSRRLSKRQLASKESLLAAGLEELCAVGYGNLTIRNVASRAGITHATAYTYFASKAHLVADLLYGFLLATPVEAPDPRLPVSARVAAAMGTAARRLGEVEALAAAGNAALLGDEPDIIELRAAIGRELVRRVEMGAGANADPELVETVVVTFAGAMLYAAFGGCRYDEVAHRVETVARPFDEERRMPS